MSNLDGDNRDAVVGFEVLSDEKVGEGGFLSLRRLRLRVVRKDGSRSREGLYDFVERPMGLDAVVLALWHRDAAGGVRVLLRSGLRVPLYFGRPEKAGADISAAFSTEVVAGIIEKGESDWSAIRLRAAAEAHEEAGLTVSPESVELLGAPTFPTTGMCPEKFYLAACEIEDPSLAVRPPGDGSPFEEGASLFWIDLDLAIARTLTGELEDLKTEVVLRRLKERLARR